MINYDLVPEHDTNLHETAMSWRSLAELADGDLRWRGIQDTDDNTGDSEILAAKSTALRDAMSRVTMGATRREVVDYAKSRLSEAHDAEPSPGRTATIATWRKVVRDLGFEPKRIARERRISRTLMSVFRGGLRVRGGQ